MEIIEVYEKILATNPDYRKKIGAFYTPKFIVDYMVSTTFEKSFEDKNCQEISEITVLDPACGGGAFLVGAYNYLLEYHTKYKQKELSIIERSSILKTNIFGVDIDPEAIKVCQKALLMTCYKTDSLEDVDEIELSENIKCGNSLISRFDLHEKYNINPENIEKYPNIKQHFEHYKDDLVKKKVQYGTPNKPYFYLHRERDEKFLKEGEKLVWAKRTMGARFTITNKSFYGSANLFFIQSERTNLKYLTAILNSKLFYFYKLNSCFFQPSTIGYLFDISIYDELNSDSLKEHINRIGKPFYSKKY